MLGIWKKDKNVNMYNFQDIWDINDRFEMGILDWLLKFKLFSFSIWFFNILWLEITGGIFIFVEHVSGLARANAAAYLREMLDTP